MDPTVSYRSISAAMCVKKEERELFQSLLDASLLPSRVHVSVFVAEKTTFPINDLRNLAYSNSVSTHVLITDIDILPSRGIVFCLSWLASLHSSFLSLPPSILDDPHLALVVPLFEMVHYTMNCNNWFDCQSEYAFPPPLILECPSSFLSPSTIFACAQSPTPAQTSATPA